MNYRKSQLGWVVIVTTLALVVFLYLGHTNQWGDNPLPLGPYIGLSFLMLAILAAFYKLTVEVNESGIRLIYGIGLIKINLKIDSLKEATVTKLPWYSGFGIKIMPNGMLYNIHGWNVVRIEYSNKSESKTVFIGSPEPHKLQEVLQRATYGQNV